MMINVDQDWTMEAVMNLMKNCMEHTDIYSCGCVLDMCSFLDMCLGYRNDEYVYANDLIFQLRRGEWGWQEL